MKVERERTFCSVSGSDSQYSGIQCRLFSILSPESGPGLNPAGFKAPGECISGMVSAAGGQSVHQRGQECG